MRTDILVFDGFDELDAIGPFEIFANARFDVALVALGGPRDVTAGHGLVLRAGAPREDVELLLVPGGGWADDRGSGVRTEVERGDIPRAAAAHHAREGTLTASVCTGAMLLAAAGILEGRPASTHHVAREDLAAAGALANDDRVTDDGDVLTAGGVTSGLDLALHIVERVRGTAVREIVQREMWLESA